MQTDSQVIRDRRTKATVEQVVDAYLSTGSVWAAAKRLGMCGQSVWERLRSIGHPMAATRWSDEEVGELTRLAGECTIGEIATRLGRPYAGIACKISELKLGVRYGNNQQRKKRIKGYPKKRVESLIVLLDSFDGSLRQFCRSQSVDLEYLVDRVQAVDRAFWDNYTRRRSDLNAKICPQCGGTYYPLTKKQRTCSRRCSSLLRTDRDYFGGKRNQTIGLADGVCQLCMEPKESLSSHHMLGKENDPENDYLIALCSGCHQLVTSLGARKFTGSEQGWENLINLVLSRRMADKNRKDNTESIGVHASVDIEWLGRNDIEDIAC